MPFCEIISVGFIASPQRIGNSKCWLDIGIRVEKGWFVFFDSILTWHSWEIIPIHGIDSFVFLHHVCVKCFPISLPCQFDVILSHDIVFAFKVRVISKLETTCFLLAFPFHDEFLKLGILCKLLSVYKFFFIGPTSILLLAKESN